MHSHDILDAFLVDQMNDVENNFDVEMAKIFGTHENSEKSGV
jgi:hypothetical protein